MALAALVRIVYFVQQSKNPFVSHPISDSLVYIAGAKKVLAGDWLGTEVFSFGGEAFYRYFLAATFAVFGHDYAAVAALQHVMGAVSCAVIYLIARRLYGPATAGVVGVWAALFPPFLFHEGLVLTSAPAVLFFVLSLYFFYSMLEHRGGGGDGGGAAPAAAAGVLLGLSALCRPNILLLSPIYFLWTVLNKSPNKNPLAGLKTLAPYALTLGVLLIILPVSIRNYYVGDDLVLISSSAGMNFFLGNNPEAQGVMYIPPDSGIQNDLNIVKSSHAAAEHITGTELKPSEASSYWFQRGMDFIMASPGAAAALFWKKFYLFWNKLELTNIYNYDYYAGHSFLLAAPSLGFGLLAAVGLLGALWMTAVGTRNEKLVPALVVTYTASVIMFFVSSRFRVPVTPLLFISAGFALRRLPSLTTYRAKVAATVAAVALFSFSCMNVEAEIKALTESKAFTYYQLGKKLMYARDYEAARLSFKAAHESDPGHMLARLNEGKALEKMDRTEEAASIFRAIIEDARSAPSDANETQRLTVYRAYKNLGLVYLRHGEYSRAEESFRSALAINRLGFESYLYLARTYQLQGRKNDEFEVLKDYLEVNPGNRTARKRAQGLAKELTEQEKSADE